MTNGFLLLVLLALFISCQKDETDNKKNNRQTIDSIGSEESLILVSEGKYDPEMVFVEGDAFVMGDESMKANQPHPVRLSSYYMATNMVTVAEWKQFLNDVQLEFTWDWKTRDYGFFYEIIPTDDCPAQGLNWYSAVIYCNWASLKDGLNPTYLITEIPEIEFMEIKVKWDKSANGYRLPTDAEWEFAARGGKKSKGFLYPGSNDPNEIGRFGNEYKTSYPVGQYKPNELGIYDMGGNASEWCWDWFDEFMFEWLPTENPSIDLANKVKYKPTSGKDKRVLRGASWNMGSKSLLRRNVYGRSAYPPINIGWIGIRLVRNAESP